MISLTIDINLEFIIQVTSVTSLQNVKFKKCCFTLSMVTTKLDNGYDIRIRHYDHQNNGFYLIL